MTDKPRRWIAALLGFFVQPLGMLYVGRLALAGLYLAFGLLIAIAGRFYLGSSPWGLVIQLAFALLCAAHAYRLATRYSEGKPRPAYSRWYGLLGAGAVLVATVFGVRAFLIEPFRMPAGSMLPTVPVGAHLVVQKWGYGNYGTMGVKLSRAPISAPLRRGDIVVFDFPPDRSIQYIKRLVGLPGDTIAYRGKSLFVNGVPVEVRKASGYVEPESGQYVNTIMESLDGAEYVVAVHADRPMFLPPSPNFPLREKCSYDKDGVSCVVPPGHYFALGDNRDNSMDSRYWGFVPADHIVGKLIYIGR